jgi:hypothetical protein
MKPPSSFLYDESGALCTILLNFLPSDQKDCPYPFHDIFKKPANVSVLYYDESEIYEIL